MFDLIKSVSKNITETTGIEISSNRYHLLERYLNERIKNLRIKNLQDFMLYIEDSNSEEFIQLINTITVNETYFFRHNDQFELLKKLLSERARSKPYQSVKIWSAGCASGPEPYSLAIIAKEIQDLYGTEISILATDIDENELNAARESIFSERAVSTEMPQKFQHIYFNKIKDGYTLKNEIKKYVKFEKLNLFSNDFPNDMDFIFCRNVLIYFNPENQLKIKTKFYQSLKNNGYLFLSPSESLFEYDEYFLPINSETGVKAYRKWTTDRRDGEDKRTISQEVIDRRRPLECYPLPTIYLNDFTDTIHIAGIIAGKNRIDFFTTQLLNVFFKYSAGASKNITNFNLNFNDMVWMSNDAINALKKSIKELKNSSIKINKIFCNNQTARIWLETSGITRLSQNYFIISQEKTEFIIKDKIEAASKTQMQVNNSKKIEKKITAGIKHPGKLKCRSLKTENDINEFYKSLVNFLKINSDSRIEIDFSDIIEINPKFAYIWRRFLKAFTDTHNKICLLTGENKKTRDWFEKNNEIQLTIK